MSDKNGKYVHIPRGHCWVEGDNRENTVDSNEFGPVPLALISAKAVWAISLLGMRIERGKWDDDPCNVFGLSISFFSVWLVERVPNSDGRVRERSY